MKKLNKIMLIFLMFGIIFMFNDSKAVNINENYSNAYEKWLNIPDSEKQNYIMPSIYTTNLEEIESINNIQAYGNDIQLPKKYNSTENLNMTVRDQGITNSCWAITSIELFEIANAKKNNLSTPVQYSSRHLDYSCSRYFLNNIENMHGFNRKVGNGANVKIGMAYFASGKGPILETSMPFQNNVDLIDIAEIQNKTVEAQLRDYIEYPNIYKSYDVNNNVTYSNGENLIYTEEQIKNFRNIVKKQIMKTGAVSSFTYAPNNRTDYNYFSNENGKIYGTSYFCNNDKLAVNHSICIVGWDDTYSKDNFKESIKPVHDGAYLVLNSWGTTWNQLDGYYYISYDDYFIEQMLFGIQNISEKNYDNIYQYDELGSDFNVSSSKSPTKIYGANVFNRKTMYKDILSDVGIYINDNNTSVKIYLDNSAERLDSIEDVQII